MKDDKLSMLVFLMFITWLAAIYCAYSYWSELKLSEKIFLEVIVVVFTPCLADLLGIFKKNIDKSMFLKR